MNILDEKSPAKDRTDYCSLGYVEIPCVSIVIQGGYDCARLVLDHLKKLHPVVVLKGSGGLADLIAYVYIEMQHRLKDMSYFWDAEFVESYLKPELSNKIVNKFPKLRDNTLARNIFRDRILECVRLSRQSGRVYLTVLNMHNSSCNLENLSEYLLMALFKSQHAERSSNVNPDLLMKDLYLSLDWNCPHVAKNEILIKDPTCIIKLEKAMFESALNRSNREEFVDLFLSHGFRLHKFITPYRLKHLFKSIHNQEFFRSVCWEGILGHQLDTKQPKDFIDNELNRLIEMCTGLDNYVNSDQLYLNVMGMYPTDVVSAERKAHVILTMWAVFSNREKLAKILWKHSDQPIHLGLIISMIYERLSWYVGEQSLRNELLTPSKLFADYAIGVLDACYSETASKSSDVLSERSPDWNYQTAVDIAANARLRSFLAHPCCQKWLTSTFLGKIRIREMSWGIFTVSTSIKILLCALLIFPMYIWVRFQDDNKEKKEDKNEEPEDEKDHVEEEIQNEQVTNEHHGTGDVPNDSNSNARSQAFQKAQNIVNNIEKKGENYAHIFTQREVFLSKQPPLFKMICLMWNAPITKFWTFQFFYVLYLTLFSIAVIYPGCGNQLLDLAVCFWTTIILIEYVRRTYILYKKYTSVPLVFKCIEIVGIISFIIIYVSGRLLYINYLSPYSKKVVLCLGLLYFYYRLFHIYLPISPTLGPLLYRLKLMVTVDFINFMRMAMLIMIGSGVAIQSILYPDYPLSWELLRITFHRAFFSLWLTPIDELVNSMNS